MWTFYPFEKLVFTNVKKKILLINICIFIPLSVYMWGVEGVTTSDVGGTYHWKQTSVGALTIINWISATLSITGHRGNLHEKENNEVK